MHSVRFDIHRTFCGEWGRYSPQGFDGSERHAVDTARTVVGQGCLVLGRSVPHVRRKTVLGVKAIHGFHPSITGFFGHDGSRRDARFLVVPLDDGAGFHLPAHALLRDHDLDRRARRA